MTNGDFDCWGDDAYGELGDGVFRDPSQPVTTPSKATVVPSTPVTAALGSNHTCVLPEERLGLVLGRQRQRPTRQRELHRPPHRRSHDRMVTALVFGRTHEDGSRLRIGSYCLANSP